MVHRTAHSRLVLPSGARFTSVLLTLFFYHGSLLHSSQPLYPPSSSASSSSSFSSSSSSSAHCRSPHSSSFLSPAFSSSSSFSSFGGGEARRPGLGWRGEPNDDDGDTRASLTARRQGEEETRDMGDERKEESVEASSSAWKSRSSSSSSSSSSSCSSGSSGGDDSSGWRWLLPTTLLTSSSAWRWLLLKWPGESWLGGLESLSRSLARTWTRSWSWNWSWGPTTGASASSSSSSSGQDCPVNREQQLLIVMLNQLQTAEDLNPERLALQQIWMRDNHNLTGVCPTFRSRGGVGGGISSSGSGGGASGLRGYVAPGLEDQSLCPWTLEQNIRRDRFPRLLWFARCLCGHCTGSGHHHQDGGGVRRRGGGRGGGGLYSCIPLYHRVAVIREVCQDRETHFRWGHESVPVGCVCAHPDTRQVT